MIPRKEINAVAAQYNLKDTQVEKDYVLHWILYALSNHALLPGILVFKGGTVLKKVYFEDYRFSEDLDFTMLDENIANEQLLAAFQDIYGWVKEEANISLQLKESFVHANGNIAFYINYIGPLQTDILSRDIKIDITRGEVLEFPIETRKVFRIYSDIPKDSFSLPCYSLPEILIEKMAALMGRTEPRDFFDFSDLTEHKGFNTAHYKAEFERKARNKKLDPAAFQEKVLSKEKNLKAGWEKKLENQIHDLPKFDDVFRRAKKHLKF